MSPNATKVFWDIVNCLNISSCSCTSYNACKATIEYQSKFSCHWHIPEPWSGDIENAPLLFILSNPSYSSTEVYPEYPGHTPPCKANSLGKIIIKIAGNKYIQQPSARIWTAKQIESFFVNRFKSNIVMSNGKRKQFVNRLRTLQNNGKYSGLVRTWLGLCKYAFALNNGNASIHLIKENYTIESNNHFQVKGFNDIVPGESFALTEIVKCKSPHMIGVKDALSECTRKHFDAVLSLFKGQMLCICGEDAQTVFNNFLIDKNMNSIPLSNKTNPLQTRKYNNLDVIFLPHPTSRNSLSINNVIITK